MRILLLIIAIALTLPLSADCQSDKVCVERHILERVANRLDSFDVAKKLQQECFKFRDSCFTLTSMYEKVITTQENVIGNQKTQIGKLQDVELEHTELLKVNDEYLKHLQKEKKKLKTKYTFSLIVKYSKH